MIEAADQLAAQAITPIVNGMVVGLGTGRAASRGIRALAQRVKTERLTIRCVATSRQSAELAASLGLTVLEMRDVEAVDLLFDGVDELDPALAMTKGGGGAMTREKIVAEAAQLRIYLMDRSKKVDRLGQRSPLPVETLEFGRAAAEARLRRLGLSPSIRMTDGGTPYRTDEGNLVLDCDYGETSSGDLRGLSNAIDSIPAVVGHGLFVDQADVVLVESALGADDGAIERLERTPR